MYACSFTKLTVSVLMAAFVRFVSLAFETIAGVYKYKINIKGASVSQKDVKTQRLRSETELQMKWRKGKCK